MADPANVTGAHAIRKLHFEMASAPHEAIAAISAPGVDLQMATDELWEAAAAWISYGVHDEQVVGVLSKYGYRIKDCMRWLEMPHQQGLELNLRLDEHIEGFSCTWYLVKCTLSLKQDGPSQAGGRQRLTWVAPRRLTHFQVSLQPEISKYLGPSYQELFSGAPFASRGGFSGTTRKLASWLERLAFLINSGSAPPHAAAVTLAFLQVPDINASNFVEDNIERRPSTLGLLDRRKSEESQSSQSSAPRCVAVAV